MLFCQKDNLKIAQNRDCLHPKDYCPYRTSCIIYYLQKEREREERRKAQELAEKKGDDID